MITPPPRRTRRRKACFAHRKGPRKALLDPRLLLLGLGVPADVEAPRAQRRRQLALPQIGRLDHVTVGVDRRHPALRHARLSTAAAHAASSVRASRGRAGPSAGAPAARARARAPAAPAP